MNIESCHTWQCINSFAPWISALGTIVISGVALWLSIRDKLIRIDASFHIAQIPGDNPFVLDQCVYMLNFINIGPRPVIVTNYEWWYKKHPFGKRKRVVTFPYLDTSVSPLCTKFPVELTDGKQGQIIHPTSFFRDLDEKSRFLFAEHQILAFYRINTFKIFICTSVGKKIKVKVDKQLRLEIWKQYREVYLSEAN